MIGLEEKLEKVKKQIDELEFNLRVCNRHTLFMHEMSDLTASDKAISSDYEKQIGHDAYRRMALQDKLRKLMNECFELEYKIARGVTNIE